MGILWAFYLNIYLALMAYVYSWNECVLFIDTIVSLNWTRQVVSCVQYKWASSVTCNISSWTMRYIVLIELNPHICVYYVWIYVGNFGMVEQLAHLVVCIGIGSERLCYDVCVCVMMVCVYVMMMMMCVCVCMCVLHIVATVGSTCPNWPISWP